jgi:pyruvate/2-oxoglutarate dehydrogenase complex dihydrolipoamide acyltransferase (E2) component
MAREGERVKDVHPYRRILQVLQPGRNESIVYFEDAIDVTKTMPWIAEWNASGRPRITLFLLMLFAMSRTLHAYPRMNRFVAGGRLYQRDGVWLSFTVKKSMKPGAGLAVVKRRFTRDEPLEGFVGEMDGAIRDARSDAPTYSDREMDLLLKLPLVGLKLVTRLVRAADRLNLLPASFIENDPFFASALMSNLGAVGGRAAFHHLFEYGTIPILATLGRVGEEVVARDGEPAVRTIARVKFSYDERIEDGFNAVAGLAYMRELIEDPARLVAPEPREDDEHVARA